MKNLLVGFLSLVALWNCEVYGQVLVPVAQPVVVYQPVLVQPAPVLIYQPVVVQTRVEPVVVYPQPVVVETKPECCWRRWWNQPRYYYGTVPFRY